MEATRSLLLVNSTMTTYLSNLEKTISEDLVKLMRMFQQLKMIKNTTTTPVASGKLGQQQISIVTDAIGSVENLFRNNSTLVFEEKSPSLAIIVSP